MKELWCLILLSIVAGILIGAGGEVRLLIAGIILSCITAAMLYVQHFARLDLRDRERQIRKLRGDI